MTAAETATTPSTDTRFHLVAATWPLVGVVGFLAAAVIAYRPALDGPVEVLLAICPWILLAASTFVLGRSFLEVRYGRELSLRVQVAAALVAFATWSVLMVDDDRWSIMTFPLFAMCFSTANHGPLVGVILAGVLSLAWAAAWVIGGSPLWTIAIPAFVFLSGSVLTLTIHRTERLNREQAELIEQLNETRRDLAATERSRGVWEERARMAGEIHDTVAQGLTSIVLLTRAARRSDDIEIDLESIEQTAQANLDAARRLVAATRPVELEHASLVQAIDRHLSTALPEAVEGRFHLVGTPRPLTGAVEVTVLRAAQEALSNVAAHAGAASVDVTLSYLDDSVALDVRDDGVGFVPGAVTDRGSLTGGQGLAALDQRARSLAGRLSIEAGESGGSVLSLLLPVVGS